jgi:hypothetical protein
MSRLWDNGSPHPNSNAGGPDSSSLHPGRSRSGAYSGLASFLEMSKQNILTATIGAYLSIVFCQMYLPVNVDADATLHIAITQEVILLTSTVQSTHPSHPLLAAL